MSRSSPNFPHIRHHPGHPQKRDDPIERARRQNIRNQIVLNHHVGNMVHQVECKFAKSSARKEQRARKVGRTWRLDHEIGMHRGVDGEQE